MGVAPSTVQSILNAAGLGRLDRGDRATSSKPRPQRYERDRPGELVHIDIKKIAAIPNGGGWRMHGRGADGHGGHSGVGYRYIHTAIDDRTRLAYSEILNDERADTTAGFFQRALEFFAANGIERVERLLTDNAWNYRNGRQLRELLAERGITHKFIKPHCPWQNGKVERFNRTLATEWAYHQVFTSNEERTAALPNFLDYYNNRRRHTALGGQAPISRLSAT